ncbi:MAG: hypothetical protein ACYCY8_02475 [Burkholderiales bacterium]
MVYTPIRRGLHSPIHPDRDISGSKRRTDLKETEMDYMGYMVFGIVALVVVDGIILISCYTNQHKHG